MYDLTIWENTREISYVEKVCFAQSGHTFASRSHFSARFDTVRQPGLGVSRVDIQFLVKKLSSSKSTAAALIFMERIVTKFSTLLPERAKKDKDWVRIRPKMYYKVEIHTVVVPWKQAWNKQSIPSPLLWDATAVFIWLINFAMYSVCLLRGSTKLKVDYCWLSRLERRPNKKWECLSIQIRVKAGTTRTRVDGKYCFLFQLKFPPPGEVLFYYYYDYAEKEWGPGRDGRRLGRHLETGRRGRK